MLIYNANFKELISLIPNWKWSELKYGLCKKYISGNDIISYAGMAVMHDVPYRETLIQLLIADEKEVDGLLEKLLQFEEIPTEDSIKSKWIFAYIYHAYNYSESRIFEIIEDIYDDFDYAEEIRSLVPYMPGEDDGLPLEEKLERYISKNQKIYC